MYDFLILISGIIFILIVIVFGMVLYKDFLKYKEKKIQEKKDEENKRIITLISGKR